MGRHSLGGGLPVAASYSGEAIDAPPFPAERLREGRAGKVGVMMGINGDVAGAGARRIHTLKIKPDRIWI